MEKLLLRVTEPAKMLDLSRSKVYVLIQAGVLPSVRVDGSRRIRADDLIAYVAIELTEGADVINAAQPGVSAALQVRATLEQLVRPSATAELPGQTPSARSSNQELKPITGLSGPDLY